MSIEKTASLIGVGVIGVLLAIVIWSREDRTKKADPPEGNRGQGELRAGIDEVRSFGRDDGARKLDFNFDDARSRNFATRDEAQPKASDESRDSVPPAPGRPLRLEADPDASARSVADSPATVTVLPGDNYSKIAKRVFGDDRRYLDIARANPSVDPRRLKPGQTIRLPGAAAPRAAAPPPQTPSSRRTHTVRKNETLSGISRRYYEVSTRWPDIMSANGALIRRPEELKPGMVLIIP